MNKLWKSVNANRTNEKFEGCKLLIASQPWTRNPTLCISLKYDFYKGTSRMKLLESNEIRQLRDVCIFEVNGIEIFL